jgi:hypothetical protein
VGADVRPLDIATPANREFVDERPGKVRTQRQALEARLADLSRLDYQPVDLETATREALAYLGRFREVLETGTLEQRKEFLRGSVTRLRSIRAPRGGRSPSTNCR